MFTSDWCFILKAPITDMELLQTHLLRPPFKPRTWKTIFAFLYAVIAMNSNLVMLAIIHDRVPADQMALPDLGFDIIPSWNFALNVSEFIMIGEVVLVLVIIGLQDCRGLLLRRLFVVVGSTYILRGFFMIVTVFPSANNRHGCAPQLNRTQTAFRGKRLVL